MSGDPTATQTPPTPTAPPAPPPARRPRLVLRSLATATVSLLLAAALLAATVVWLLATTSGMNALIALANRFAPVQIEARGSFGAFSREFGFDELKVTVNGTVVTATGLRAQIAALEREPPRIDFAHLGAKTLRVQVTTDPAAPHDPVQDIGIPLRLTSPQLRIGELTIAVDATEFSLQEIATAADAGPDGYRVENGRLAWAAQRAELNARLGAARPFAFEAQGKLAAQVQQQAIGAVVRASGSLVDMQLDAELSGAASGTASARIASFDAPAVRSLVLDLAGINPRHWHAAAPLADLAVRGELVPNEAMDRVAGSLSVVNRAAGLIDAGRIPARSAAARVELTAERLSFDRIRAQLLQGTASGEFALLLADGRWQANAQLADVDPARLHGALQPLRVDGRVQARQTAAAIEVSAALEHRGRPEARLDFDGRFTPTLAAIDRARLALGDGYATTAGRVELTGGQRVELRGELHRFEPGRLVKGVDAELTGSLLVDGALRPKPAGRLRFELKDSDAWGRPLAGRGRIDLDASQRLDVDIGLSLRSAKLVAKGGLGAADRALELTFDAPALADLMPPAAKSRPSGSLTLAATARGDWAAPAFQLRLAGKELRYGEHAIASVEADAEYGGGSDGALRLLAGLAGYRYVPQPNATAQSVSLVVGGRLSKHAIEVKATLNKRQGATLLADGGWLDDAWRGRVREAMVGSPLELRLLLPAPLVVGLRGVELGPAQLAVQHVRFDDVRLRADDLGLATRGRFSGLEPMRFAVPVEGALTPVLPPERRAPLVLDGGWDLNVAKGRIDGRLFIERESGDLYAGRGPDSALGLVDARVEATIAANRLAAFARFESAANGGIGAAMEAWLEHSEESGWRLAQERPWLIAAALELPTMDWINALLSDHLRANVRLGGKLTGTMRIEGTPASPSAVGRLDGDALRVAWIEQGVRLENGRLRAVLRDDLVVLDELRFSGPPRVRPDDRRAAAALPADRVGSVNATGQLRLRGFSGVIQVAADQLPLLQRPDRWVIASGGANIETSAKHVQFNGAFAAEAGFASLAFSELPSLSQDVVVVRAGDEAAARARRVTIGFDLGIDLGQHFFLRGRGIDTRVEGAVRLRSAGRGAVTATGTLAAVDGVYEGFGQRLNIARGRLNFQGAPENPGLDILALRTGLPVEVGVTITRTAADPLVRLHSDPPMTDAEALSWLVLGRAPDQGGGDNVALARAAASLLGGGGEGYPTRVARAIGIDELSIRSGNFGIASLLPSRGVAGSLRSDEASAATVAGEIITLRKNLTDALTVSYEQAISGTTRFLQLNYQLSRRLSVVARAGTSNALDFVYTIAFD